MTSFTAPQDPPCVLTKRIRRGEPLVLFCGAGVSVDAPAAAPDWIGLRDGILDSLVKSLQDDGPWRGAPHAAIAAAMQSLKIKRAVGDVKPELVLECLHTVLGDRMFAALTVLRRGAPNAHHRAIASLCTARAVKAVVTTNFDTYIEDACGADRLERWLPTDQEHSPSFSRPCLLKLHGTLDVPPSIQVTMSQVGRPTPKRVIDVLSHALHDSHVVVIGYSGFDYDLFPALVDSARRSRSAHWLIRPGGRVRPEILALGSPFQVLSGGASETLDALLLTAGIDPIASSAVVPMTELPIAEKMTLAESPPEAARVLATFALYAGSQDVVNLICRPALAREVEIPLIHRARLLNLLAVQAKWNSPRSAPSVFRYALRAIKREDRAGSVYANLLGNLGSTWHELGKHRAAKSWLMRSTRVAEAAGVEVTVAQNLDDLGSVARSLGDLVEAVRLHERASHWFRSKGRLQNLAKSLTNLGLDLIEQCNHERAIVVLREAYDLKRHETSDLGSIARTVQALGQAELNAGNTDAAVTTTAAAWRFARRARDASATVAIGFDAALVRAVRGRRDLALRAYGRAWRRAEGLGYWLKDPARHAGAERAKRRILEFGSQQSTSADAHVGEGS